MNIIELPVELLVAICCRLPSVTDLIHFESVCKTFQSAVHQEEVWKERIEKDFSFNVSKKSPVFRRRGFRQLYRALQNPQVFVWGSKDDGRLGLPEEILDAHGGLFFELDYPFWLKSMSQKGVSTIVCGGYMMLALTHQKQVYFWGTFNAETYMYPYSKIQETPMLLDIFPKGTQIQHISVGRSHALALTNRGEVYQFDNPEQNASLVIFDGQQPSVSQLACGFNGSVCLTQEQKIFYWRYEAGIKVENYTLMVPPLLKDDESFCKLAAGENFVMASTNIGRVVCWEIFDQDIEGAETTTDSFDVHNLSLHHEIHGEFLVGAESLKVEHLNAQFRNFGLFDDKGALWLGRSDPVDDGRAREWRLSPLKLEGKGNPILCSFGDWHTAVLFDNGHLYTWGEHALGHGPHDTKALSEPQRVYYFTDDHFVFYVSCAGWHTAALAVDLSIPPAAEPPGYPEPVCERDVF